ncbi:hypothetical protein NDU88_003690, partial [Pleurodeles waltl]
TQLHQCMAVHTFQFLSHASSRNTTHTVCQTTSVLAVTTLCCFSTGTSCKAP